MSEWRTIKTAPKDGSWVLLWLPKNNVAISGCWDEVPGETCDGHLLYPAFDDWLIDEDLIILDDPDWYPTHWMALPKAPKKANP